MNSNENTVPLPKRIRIEGDLADAEKPDVMTIEALLSPEIVDSYDDGNGGRIAYLYQVGQILKRLKNDANKTIQKVIKQYPT